jgi:hypothetical protein
MEFGSTRAIKKNTDSKKGKGKKEKDIDKAGGFRYCI